MFVSVRQGAILAVTAAALILVAVLSLQNRSLRDELTDVRLRQATPQEGEFLPAFEARTVGDGRGLRIAGGEPDDRQVLFVFRTTCSFCEASLPAVNRLARQLSEEGIPLIGIALDSIDDARAYQVTKGLHFPVTTFPDVRVRRLYRVGRVPATLVVSGDGRIVHARIGVMDRTSTVDSVAAAATSWGSDPRDIETFEESERGQTEVRRQTARPSTGG